MPVCALATTSSPRRAAGNASSWIGVMRASSPNWLSKFAARRELRPSVGKGRPVGSLFFGAEGGGASDFRRFQGRVSTSRRRRGQRAAAAIAGREPLEECRLDA